MRIAPGELEAWLEWAMQEIKGEKDEEL